MRDRFKFANYMIYARSAKNFALFKPFHKKLALFCQKQGRNKGKLMVFLFLKHNFPLFWLFFSRGRQFFRAVGNLITLISSLFFKNAYLFPPGGRMRPKYTPLENPFSRQYISCSIQNTLQN